MNRYEGLLSEALYRTWERRGSFISISVSEWNWRNVTNLKVNLLVALDNVTNLCKYHI